MGALLFVLGTIGVMTAIVRGSNTEPKQEVKREVKRIENKREEKGLSSSSSGSSLSIEKTREIMQRVYDKNLNLYYSAPKSQTIINNHYNFTTVHNHITINNHNTYNYFDHCSFHESYNFSLNLNKCPHCGK